MNAPAGSVGSRRVRRIGAPLSIDVRALRKSYADDPVIDGLNLCVPQGAVHALLGPESSGKTTVLRLLSARVAADSGDARIAGHRLGAEPDAVRAAVGVTWQTSVLDNLLTTEQNLLLTADLHRLPRREGRRIAAELLARCGLQAVATEPASSLSRGMRRRLDLAVTLVAGPRVVLLDEPTEGLDRCSREMVHEVVRALAAQGATVLVTTRRPEEVERLADRIGLLHHGRVVAEGTADELKRLAPGRHIRIAFARRAELDAAADRFRLHTVVRDDSALILDIPSDGSPGLLRAVLDLLDSALITPRWLTQTAPTLDDVFASLTGGGRGPFDLEGAGQHVGCRGAPHSSP